MQNFLPAKVCLNKVPILVYYDIAQIWIYLIMSFILVRKYLNEKRKKKSSFSLGNFVVSHWTNFLIAFSSLILKNKKNRVQNQN